MSFRAARNTNAIPGLRIAALGLVLVSGSMTNALWAQSPDEVSDKDLTAYQKALLNYKSGHEDVALAAIEAAEKEKPADPATEILKARIQTESLDFAGARKSLEGLNGNPGLTGDMDVQRTLAFGDLCLRKHSFAEATKYYEALLGGARANDPDIKLKAIYARIGANDLATAEKDASQLKPLDPDHPTYYFAKAALSQATGKGAAADDDIQTVRTIYGITVTNRYLKTYLELFSNSDKTTPAAVLTPPATNAPPKQP